MAINGAVFSMAIGVLGSAFLSCESSLAATKINTVYKSPPKPGLIAKVGNDEITEEHLFDGNEIEFFMVEQQVHDFKVQKLNQLLTRMLLDKKAGAEGISLADYIEKKIIQGKLLVTESDIKEFIREKKLNEGQITSEVKKKLEARIYESKRQQMILNHLAKLTQKTPVEVYLERPKLKTNIEAGSGPMFGETSAPITIVEFSDFQCSYCSRAAETVDALKKKYGSKIRIAFRNLPLPMHESARPAAEASLCVNEQGTNKFWKFHDLVFKNQDKLDQQNLEKFAAQAGANLEKYKVCFKERKYSELVQKDIDYAQKVGIRGTPTFVINDQLLTGAPSMEAFAEIIDEQLSNSKGG